MLERELSRSLSNDIGLLLNDNYLLPDDIKLLLRDIGVSTDYCKLSIGFCLFYKFCNLIVGDIWNLLIFSDMFSSSLSILNSDPELRYESIVPNFMLSFTGSCSSYSFLKNLSEILFSQLCVLLDIVKLFFCLTFGVSGRVFDS